MTRGKKKELLSEEVSKTSEASWKRVLEVADHDELVYKLTLKYLRQKRYDIGNNTISRIKKLACKTLFLFLNLKSRNRRHPS
jgi:hypothetical protein